MERKGKKLIWEPEHIEFIRDNIDHMSFEKMGDVLGVSFTTVRLKAVELGIHRSTSIRCIRWTEEQLNYLREHYPTTPLCDLSPVLGCSEETIRRKAHDLGLKRAEDYTKSKFYGRYVKKYKQEKI